MDALCVSGCTQPGYSPIGSGCYRVSQSFYTFADAEAGCSTEGNLLVALETQDELDSVRNWLLESELKPGKMHI